MGCARQDNSARLADPLQPRGDIHAVAHQIAIALLDDVADVNPDAKFDSALRRQTRVALDHAGLHLDRAAHRVDHAAKLDDASVAGSLHDAAAMRGDGGVDQIAAKTTQTRERAIFVGSRKPGVADDVSDQDGRELAGLAHGAPVVVTLPQFPS